MVTLMQRRRDMMKARVVNRVYLYNEGNEYSSITGGWDAGVGFVSQKTRYATDKTNNCLEIETVAVSSSSGAQSISTHNAIDLTSYSTLYIVAESYRPTSTGTVNFWVYLPSTLATASNQTNAYGSDYASKRQRLSTNLTGTRVTVSVNVTSYTSAYLSLNLNTWSNAAAGCYGKVYSVWLE